MPNTLTFGDPLSIAEKRANNHNNRQMDEMHRRFGVIEGQTCLGCKYLVAKTGVSGIRNYCVKYSEHRKIGTRWKAWFMACGAFEAAKKLVWK